MLRFVISLAMPGLCCVLRGTATGTVAMQAAVWSRRRRYATSCERPCVRCRAFRGLSVGHTLCWVCTTYDSKPSNFVSVR